MGKVVEKKKKKKGRPSLLDLQKRSLKEQQEQLKKQHQHKFRNTNSIPNPNPNPNSNSNSGVRRSTRRNPNPRTSGNGEEVEEEEEQLSGRRRREKKLKLVLKLPESTSLNSNLENSGSDVDGDEGNTAGTNHRKRKIGAIAGGSGQDNDDKHVTGANQVDAHQEVTSDDGPSTALPDKKLLLFIMDRLQKKDTYGVFAEPVDPEELPDYHEIIQHPMDFGTIRKKLDRGAYHNLEQFEKDVFLVCSNAMQYNSPDTIYFRQARSIQELAQKNFENLRQDSDDNEPETKVVRRGRPPTKNIKKPVGRPPLDRTNSEFSEATLATGGESASRSNHDSRKGPHPIEKYGSTDSFGRPVQNSRHSENYIGWSAERYDRIDEFTGSLSKGISMKHGKKNIVVDENKRNTYKQPCVLGSRKEPSLFTTFDAERKQLIAVGLHTEHGYARSLARFAAKLSPVAWKVASRKIERCLPVGVQFGRGWVCEDDTAAQRPLLPPSATAAAAKPSPSGPPSITPSQGGVGSYAYDAPQNPEGSKMAGLCVASNKSKLDAHSIGTTTSVPASLTVASNSGPSSMRPELNKGTHPHMPFSMLSGSFGAIRPSNHFQMNQTHLTRPQINGLNGTHPVSITAQLSKLTGPPRPMSPGFGYQSHPVPNSLTAAETNCCDDPNETSENSSKFESRHQQQNTGSVPPDLNDLNVGFQSPKSPGSAKNDSAHPDLALQLFK